MKNTFSKFTIITTVFALILGNLVVATNSGDACGTDWPKCNGQIIPDFSDINILIEYSHRLFTTALGFVILLNAIFAWRKRKKKNTKIFSIVTILLLILQSLVGGLNVLLGTPTGFTTIDVTVSLLLLCSVIYLYYSLEEPSANKNIELIKKPSKVLLIVIFIETIIGAFFKHSRISQLLYSTSSELPLIDSLTLSNFIYFLHGILGIVTVLASIFLLFSAYSHDVYKARSTFLVGTLVITTLFGFLTKIYELSPFTSSMHMIFTTFSIAICASITATNNK
ncbi:COX15/CtaA family protein [Mesobacillus maritimus]|uniref:COX15/CtaA family protein n=1 Tax=Mesobacillus maritimus TaxID=1643336 RepID=UPI00203CFA08|nr:COX15/CtaA family protein [Mesobacillus maritimus]MCM3669000.1 COX15/CtaA family protein [Mesobacillus maritimus]